MRNVAAAAPQGLPTAAAIMLYTSGTIVSLPASCLDALLTRTIYDNSEGHLYTLYTLLSLKHTPVVSTDWLLSNDSASPSNTQVPWRVNSVSQIFSRIPDMTETRAWSHSGSHTEGCMRECLPSCQENLGLRLMLLLVVGRSCLRLEPSMGERIG